MSDVSYQDDVIEADVDENGDTAEDRARAATMGWHSKDESSARSWVNARTFIERGETILPIARDNNRRLTDKVIGLETEMATLRTTFERSSADQLQALKDMRALAQRADKQGYERALRELKAQRAEAVATGDVVAFDQIDQQIDTLEAERAESVIAEPVSPPPPPATPPPPAIDPAITAFIAANSWFETEPDLRQEAIAQHNYVIAMNPNMAETKRLELAKARVVEKYPERFEAEERDDDRLPPRQRAATVVTPRPGGTRQTPKTGFDAIADPAERADAQRAYQNFKRQMPDYTVEEYMALYTGGTGDVLTVQDQIKRNRARG